MTIPQIICPICGASYIMNPSDYSDNSKAGEWITFHLRSHSVGEILSYFEIQMAAQYAKLTREGEGR